MPVQFLALGLKRSGEVDAKSESHRSGGSLVGPSQEDSQGLRADIEVREGILVASVSGQLTFESALRVLKKVSDAAKENGVNKILVNALGMHGEASTGERYDFGLEMLAHFKERQMKPWVAFVGKPPAMDGFAVRVSQNRGLGIEVFSSLQDALNWLEKWPI